MLGLIGMGRRYLLMIFSIFAATAAIVAVMALTVKMSGAEINKFEDEKNKEMTIKQKHFTGSYQRRKNTVRQLILP